VQYAIDVPSILQAAYFGVANPSTGIIPPGLCGHRENALIPPKANIKKAKQLLKEAGHPDGINLTLDVRNKEAYVTTAQVIQSTLAQAGIELKINVHDSGSFWSLGDDSKGDRWKKIQLVLNRFSSAPDPYYAAQWFTKDQIGIWNWERFNNDEYNGLHKKAISESDKDKRCAMYRRMQELMEESGAYRFITHEANPVIYSNTIKPALRPDGMPLLQYFKKS
jgi:peptide/nickel transport system substrate-binding protein